MTWKGWTVLLLTGIMGGLIFGHVDFVNGPAYWKWPWRRLDPAAIILLGSLTIVYCVTAWWVLQRRISHPVSLVLISSISFAMCFTAATTQQRPWGMDRLAGLITSKYATGYLDDAARMPSGWLGQFPTLMRNANPHTSTKPAGPVLFYRVMLWLSDGDLRAAAAIGGLVLMGMTALGVGATYWAVREITQDPAAALLAAVVLGLMPGFVLLASQFDPAYVALVAVMVAAWARALRKRSMLWAGVSGVALAIVVLFAFHLLVIGLFMFLLPTMTRNEDVEEAGPFAQRLLSLGGVVIGLGLTLHGLLYAFTGYNSLTAFATAHAKQAEFAAILSARRLPDTIGWDLYDYLLGVGWVVIVPLLIAIHRALDAIDRRYAWAVLVQLLSIALLGLLPAETARVWLFLTPTVLAPVAAVASSWSLPDRTTLILGTAVCMLSIHTNMIFLQQ